MLFGLLTTRVKIIVKRDYWDNLMPVWHHCNATVLNESFDTTTQFYYVFDIYNLWHDLCLNVNDV